MRERDSGNMIPSREIAKRAKMAWDGLSEEEATIEANKGTGKDAIDSVWAGKSVSDAIEGICTELNLTEEEKEELIKATYDGPENEELFNTVVSKIQSHPEKERMIINILSGIHDGWVVDNAGRFDEKLEKGQARQYAPLELIGWNEATSDLLFLEPILNSLGVEVNMELLQNEFYKRLAEYVEINGIESTEDLERIIYEGSEVYPALEGELEKKVLENYKTVARQIIENWKTNDKQSSTVFEQQRLKNIQESQDFYDSYSEKKEEFDRVKQRVNYENPNYEKETHSRRK